MSDKTPLPPRQDVVTYNNVLHEDEFNAGVQWDTCPEDKRPKIEQILKDFWDVFAAEGLRKPIRGYQFHIDTGNVKPVCCKPPRYGPHETRIMSQLIQGLEQNGVIEDDDGPWGAMVVLAAKPNQAHKHWSDYIWRLCVSYRQLNTVTRPFVYPSRRCDDAVRAIGHSIFFITMDLFWGYWQILLNSASRSKTGFFVPSEKRDGNACPWAY